MADVGESQYARGEVRGLSACFLTCSCCSWEGWGWGAGGMVAACQTAGHDGGHRPGDHGPVVGREALVVADGAAVAADPDEGALHHPAARQHLDGVAQAPAEDGPPKAQGGSR